VPGVPTVVPSSGTLPRRSTPIVSGWFSQEGALAVSELIDRPDVTFV